MEPKIIEWKIGQSGVGILTLGRPKIDSGDPDKRNWDGTLTVKVEAADEVGQMSLFYGDISKHFHDAVEEEARFQGKITPLKGNQHTVRFSTDGEILLERISVEVRDVAVDFNTSRQIQKSRIILHGLSVMDSNALVSAMESLVHVEIVNPSMLSIVGDPDAPEVGQLVSGVTPGGSVVVGRMVRIDGDTDRPVVSDFGTEHEIQQVSSAFWLESTDDTSVDDHAESYLSRSIEAASWQWLVEAMATSGREGHVKAMSGSTGYLNSSVVDLAVGASNKLAEVEA